MRIALVRGIPDSFSESLKLEVPKTPIHVGRAKEQHGRYVAELMRLVDRVIEIPADPRFPDCCFVEDTAVVAGDRAVITRPGAPSRNGEQEQVGVVLGSLGLATTAMTPPATLDGGDVLRVGNHVFVGRSSRTNEAGIEQLARVFCDYQVHAVPVDYGLHLKSMLSLVGEWNVAVARCPAGERAAHVIKDKVPDMRFTWLPDLHAANCLLIGENLIHLAGYPASRGVLEGTGKTLLGLDMGELEKADGGLTCLSIVVER
ncbi:MAG: amidinotransferase [Deltaproteobacteria bacterium]|nr:amidinotransferase [Deltaproteobacteria bacterium]